MDRNDKKCNGSGVSSVSAICGNVHIPQKVYKNQLVFRNHYEFPAIGEEGKLYIATDENAMYFFSSTHYVCVGRNYEEVKTIQCVL